MRSKGFSPYELQQALEQRGVPAKVLHIGVVKERGMMPPYPIWLVYTFNMEQELSDNFPALVEGEKDDIVNNDIDEAIDVIKFAWEQEKLKKGE